MYSVSNGRPVEEQIGRLGERINVLAEQERAYRTRCAYARGAQEPAGATLEGLSRRVAGLASENENARKRNAEVDRFCGEWRSWVRSSFQGSADHVASRRQAYLETAESLMPLWTEVANRDTAASVAQTRAQLESLKLKKQDAAKHLQESRRLGTELRKLQEELRDQQHSFPSLMRELASDVFRPPLEPTVPPSALMQSPLFERPSPHVGMLDVGLSTGAAGASFASLGPQGVGMFPGSPAMSFGPNGGAGYPAALAMSMSPGCPPYPSLAQSSQALGMPQVQPNPAWPAGAGWPNPGWPWPPPPPWGWSPQMPQPGSSPTVQPQQTDANQIAPAPSSVHQPSAPCEVTPACAGAAQSPLAAAVPSPAGAAVTASLAPPSGRGAEGNAQSITPGSFAITPPALGAASQLSPNSPAATASALRAPSVAQTPAQPGDQVAASRTSPVASAMPALSTPTGRHTLAEMEAGIAHRPKPQALATPREAIAAEEPLQQQGAGSGHVLAGESGVLSQAELSLGEIPPSVGIASASVGMGQKPDGRDMLSSSQDIRQVNATEKLADSGFLGQAPTGQQPDTKGGHRLSNEYHQKGGKAGRGGKGKHEHRPDLHEDDDREAEAAAVPQRQQWQQAVVEQPGAKARAGSKAAGHLRETAKAKAKSSAGFGTSKAKGAAGKGGAGADDSTSFEASEVTEKPSVGGRQQANLSSYKQRQQAAQGSLGGGGNSGVSAYKLRQQQAAGSSLASSGSSGLGGLPGRKAGALAGGGMPQWRSNPSWIASAGAESDDEIVDDL